MRRVLARAAVMSAVLFAALNSAHAQTRSPRIEPVDCAKLTTLAPGVVAECGYLRVPEDRARPSSRLIGVPFVIVRSAARTDPDPTVMFTGGPGGRVIPRRVGPNTTGIPAISAALRGRVPGDDAWAEAAEIAAASCRPSTDGRGSAAYKRHLAGELTRRTLRTAWERVVAWR